MLSIAFTAGDVTRVRFGLSCLWEAASSFHVLAGPQGRTVLLPWMRRVRPALEAAGLAPGGPNLLSGLIPPGRTYMPDFLTPPSATLDPGIEAELDVLRATPHDVVRADLASMDVAWSPRVRAMDADPAAGLDRLTRELRTYWEIALAPHWPRMRSLLEAEVFRRARLVAAEGVRALLSDLHPGVEWDDDTLSVPHSACTLDVKLLGDGLLLVPCVFVWPTTRAVTDAANSQIAYPPQGVATLWENADSPPEALAAVVGRARARLLSELEAPASTTELARRTGLTAGGVSQHLAILRAAGLVVPRREGRAVLNVRTPAGETLLGAVHCAA